MSSRLLYYCFIHRAWTNYFNSSLWGADWQLPSLEWSVCFSDSAKAVWCILTIIGATATMMFGKPLCYFPGGCPRGMKSAQSSETPSEAGQMGRLLSCVDQWHHDLIIIIIIITIISISIIIITTYGYTVCLVVSSDQRQIYHTERKLQFYGCKISKKENQGSKNLIESNSSVGLEQLSKLTIQNAKIRGN